MEVSKDQMSMLLENNLFESAQMLGCFLVSSPASNQEPNPYLKAEYLVLQGDAFYGGKEYRRALSAYKQALQNCKSIPRQGGNSTRTSLSATTRSPSPSSFSISTINENEVKFKVALCLSTLNEHRSALFEMESIPSKARTLRMNLTMGKLYRISRNNRSASTCYKECLRQCPYVLEAITALAELGVSSKEIILLFSQTPTKIGRFSSDYQDSQRWLNRYVEAQCCIASNDYKGTK
ncbi:Anaphase-promoting complex subunit 7 [Rhynchospora pubera]|uniref:Anaphase-promoting complex subunit 7 n=1 Tax=Rhynchospora pubera TaxID=906938 RepID=A0AAV8AT78_9POAL|nr:Anaphase-promoting complex subunit 7 [Rhynchospora pubera]